MFESACKLILWIFVKFNCACTFSWSRSQSLDRRNRPIRRNIFLWIISFRCMHRCFLQLCCSQWWRKIHKRTNWSHVSRLFKLLRYVQGLILKSTWVKLEQGFFILLSWGLWNRGMLSLMPFHTFNLKLTFFLQAWFSFAMRPSAQLGRIMHSQILKPATRFLIRLYEILTSITLSTISRMLNAISAQNCFFSNFNPSSFFSFTSFRNQIISSKI